MVIGCVVPNWGAPVARLVARELAADSSWPRITLTCDTTAAGPPDAALAAAEGMVATPGIIGVVGHGGSRESLVAAPIYEAAGVAEVVPTGTSRHLAAAGSWVFPIAPNDSVESEFLAAYVTDSLKARAVSILYANDDYGVGMADGVSDALARRGVRLRSRIPVGVRSDLSALVRAEMKLRPVDALIVATGSQIAANVVRVVDSVAPMLPVVAGDGAAIPPDLSRTLGGAPATHLTVITFWSADDIDSASRAFVEQYRRVAGSEPHASQAMTYDALHLLIRAIRASGGDARVVRSYLRSLGRSEPPYHGVTGPIVFGGGEQGMRLVLTHLDGDRLVRGGAR